MNERGYLLSELIAVAPTRNGTSGCYVRPDAPTFLFELPRRLWRIAPFSFFLISVSILSSLCAAGSFRPFQPVTCSPREQVRPSAWMQNPRCWFPPHQREGSLFSAMLGAYSPAQPERGSGSLFFERMNILFFRNDGATEWLSIKGFFFPERHSFQRLTITWASRWRGILV